jgi:hypothetical protein
MLKLSVTKILLGIVFISFSSLLLNSCEPEQVVENVLGPGGNVTVTVLSPNGGELIQVATAFEIRWASNTKGNLRIEYSDDNGASWNLITGNMQNTGSFIWSPVPNRISDECKIRISTTDNLSADESDSFFSIIPNQNKTVTVTKPNGGEVAYVGSLYQIEWVSSSVQNVKIELSTNAGTTWNTLSQSYPADSSNFKWEPVPNSPSANCLIKITDVSNDTISDVSNSPFAIAVPQEIKVISPNGGEKWNVNSSQNISWYSSQVSDVKIEYTTNNGLTWNTIVESTPSDGFFTWDPVPNAPSANSKIRISDALSGFPSDASDSVFSILPEQALRVLTPNGGENWLAGTTQTISWYGSTASMPGGKSGSKNKLSKYSGGKLSPANITDVKIEFSTNSGATWNVIVESTPNTGSFDWIGIPSLTSTLCKVKVSDAADGSPFDVSDNTFTIYNTTTQEISVTSPNGGELWEVGSTQDIKWNSSGISNVKIEYTTNNGVEWKVISQTTPSDGFYTWTNIPNFPSTNCKVRVTDADDNFPADECDGFFSIVPSSSITVSSPNGGESWQTGSNQNITWTSVNVSDVKIEYSTNNGASWLTVVESTPSTGMYAWNPVPDANSSNCKIRITDVVDGFPSDVSDNGFTIYNTGFQEIVVTSPNGGEVWQAGSTKNITWNTTGVGSVKIEYTINNGVNWITIVESTPSTGVYTWSNVPNSPSTNCKIRILDATDGQPSDLSDDFFTIASEEVINVVSPNGGEVWIAGTNQNITWNTSGGVSRKLNFKKEPMVVVRSIPGGTEAVSDVKIEYTTNGGASWLQITGSTSNTGSYLWSVPVHNSSQCRIRISDALDGVPVDLSDANFTITTQDPQTIKVTQPNGGEIWGIGSNQNITWTSEGISNVKIEFTTNNGVDWTTITASTPSNGIYSWTSIPSTPSTNCKIRISDASDGIPSDLSDNVFTITSEEAITVTSPNGGENWTIGSTQTITWNSTGNRPMKFNFKKEPMVKMNAGNSGIESIINVMIELSTNGGTNWQTVVSSTPNNGNFNWTVPSVASSLCKIRISDASDGSPFDVSDNNFTIYSDTMQIITVNSPNGGEVWGVGTNQNVTWNSSGINNVKIEYTLDNGLNWNTITNSTPSTGFYSWLNLPNTPSFNCKVRISDAADGYPSDVSNAPFTITNQDGITVLSPNGGENWLAGSVQIISWASTGGTARGLVLKKEPLVKSKSNLFNPEAISDVKIEYTTNGGANWITIISSTPNTGNYSWTIPSLNSSQCRVRISDVVNPAVYDVSDNNFTIYNDTPQQIEVTSPNGGEVWQASSSQNITWTSTSVENVRIEFTTNNGVSWTTIVASTPSDGFYTWVPLPNTPSTNCKVRITDVADGFPSDASNSFFTIAPETDITVTTPNGGETWIAGTSQNITWTSINISDVKIEYTTNGGANWTQIVASTPSVGVYTWDPIPNVYSTQCKIRISDASDGSPFDISDANFTISNEQIQTITVTSPNGGEIWQSGTSQNITWSTANIADVKIEYTTNNGINWNIITASTPNSGSYEWSPIPDINSTACKVRISDVVDGEPMDASDEPFTIFPVQELMIIVPNGGEVYNAGDPVNIIWSSQGVENVKIEYTINNGILPEDWFVLVESTPSDGSYQTGFSIPSNQYRIRISDAEDGSPTDLGDGTFTIQLQPQINIITPNGGENWLVGETYEIRWESNVISNINIEYTLNGGATWESIAANYPNTGSYFWTVPLTITQSSDVCKIKISDAVDGSPSDQSNGFFSIQAGPSVRVVFPNGGEHIDRIFGPDTNIIWTSSGVANVSIDYTLDNGVTWINIIPSTPSTGSFRWILPPRDVRSSLTRVRVTDVSNPSIKDQSDSYFYLNTFPPELELLFKSGESWQTGKSKSISWYSSVKIKKVKLEYSIDNGVTWKVIAENIDSKVNTKNSYKWKQVPTGQTLLIRISDMRQTFSAVSNKIVIRK